MECVLCACEQSAPPTSWAAYPPPPPLHTQSPRAWERNVDGKIYKKTTPHSPSIALRPPLLSKTMRSYTLFTLVALCLALLTMHPAEGVPGRRGVGSASERGARHPAKNTQHTTHNTQQTSLVARPEAGLAARWLPVTALPARPLVGPAKAGWWQQLGSRGRRGGGRWRPWWWRLGRLQRRRGGRWRARRRRVSRLQRRRGGRWWARRRRVSRLQCSRGGRWRARRRVSRIVRGGGGPLKSGMIGRRRPRARARARSRRLLLRLIACVPLLPALNYYDPRPCCPQCARALPCFAFPCFFFFFFFCCYVCKKKKEKANCPTPLLTSKHAIRAARPHPPLPVGLPPTPGPPPARSRRSAHLLLRAHSLMASSDFKKKSPNAGVATRAARPEGPSAARNPGDRRAAPKTAAPARAAPIAADRTPASRAARTHSFWPPMTRADSAGGAGEG